MNEADDVALTGERAKEKRENLVRVFLLRGISFVSLNRGNQVAKPITKVFWLEGVKVK